MYTYIGLGFRVQGLKFQKRFESTGRNTLVLVDEGTRI